MVIMELRTVLLFVAITAAAASPVDKVSVDDDLIPAEGRSQYTRSEYGGGQAHGGPEPLYAPSSYASPRQGHVSSYNRRGHNAEYGLRFSGQSAYGGQGEYNHAQSAQAYAAPAPVASAYSHQQDERGYGRGSNSYGGGGGGYGPANSISGQSQQYSQDPEYDPSKDPVSQYAAYIPVRDYSTKKDTHREALSIYGYRK